MTRKPAIIPALPQFLPLPTVEDRREFGVLPDECRADIRTRYAAIARCLAARNARGVKAMWEAEARKLAANRAGCTMEAKTLQNLASRFVLSARGNAAAPGVPDWRVLWNKSRWICKDVRFTVLPDAFVADWKRRVLSEVVCDHRAGRAAVGGIKAAHKRLLADWKAARREGTHPFPGYDLTPPPADGKNHPAGWSLSNLSEARNCPTEAERVAWRKGTGSARRLLPFVMSTRADVLAGQRYEFDDFEPDYELVEQGQRIKPLVLSALDFGTGCSVHHVAKPAWRRADGSVDKWKLAHVPLFLAAFMLRAPFDAFTGTTLVDEGGTMRIDGTLQELLATATQGRVTIDGADPTQFGLVARPNRHRLGQVAGFAGGAVGNSNRKARIENWHRALRNTLGNLPGYTGSNYTQKPDYLAGIQQETDALLKRAESLTPERRDSLQFHLLSFAKFTEALAAGIAGINAEDDHKLEGWARHTLDCIRDGEKFLPHEDLAMLPAVAASALITAAEHDASLFVPQRRLSRGEAWQRECREGLRTGRLAMLSPWDCAEIVALAGKSEPGLNTIRPREVRSAYIVVEDTTLAREPEPIFFAARITQMDGTERELENGEDVECVFNPFAPDVLFIRRKGQFLGVAKRATKINPNDRAETLAAFAEARSRRAERLAGVREIMAPHTDAIAARRAHNERVCDTAAPLTAGERHAASALAAAKARIAEATRISRQNAETETY